MLHADNVKMGEIHGPAQVSSTATKAWLVCAVLGFFVYHVIANQHFTVMLTFSGFAQALSFVLLQIQIWGSRSVAGISGKALIMHATKLCCRLSSTLWLDGYLPVDKSGDWIYQAVDVLSLVVVLRLLFCVHVSHKGSYQAAEDTLNVQNLIVGAFILAVFIHPSQNSFAPFDIMWAAHLYIDALAMVPQLWMVSKAGGQVRELTAHYIAATLLSNLLSLYFWFLASEELHKTSMIPALAVHGAHAVQVLLLLDFGYFYCKACLQGRCGRGTMLDLGSGSLDI